MKKILCYPAILFFALLSCDRKEFSEIEIAETEKIFLTPEEIMSVSFNSPKEISESQVLGLVKDFPLSLGPEVKSKLQDATFKINKKLYFNESGEFTSTKKISTKSSHESVLPIYDVDISKGDNKMRALVSADERFPSVLAFVPNNSEASNFDIYENPMYLNALEVATAKIEFYEKLKDSLHLKTLDKLSKVTGTRISPDTEFADIKKFIQFDKEVLTKNNGGGGQGTGGNVVADLPTMIINQIGPFTQTRWAQSSWGEGAYDHKMPMSNLCGNGDERAPAGCVTVAIAQILAHTKPALLLPNYTSSGSFMLNWNILATDYLWSSPSDPGYHQMGSLMRYLAEELGSYQICSNQLLETSVTSSKIPTVLKKYTTTYDLQNFSSMSTKNSLDNLQLVYAQGNRLTANNGKSGHAWVLDGYAICRKGTGNGNNGSNEMPNKYDLYLHANMGWGAGHPATGWYLVNNDWSMKFDTGESVGEANAPNPNDPGRRNYRLDLKAAYNAGPK